MMSRFFLMFGLVLLGIWGFAQEKVSGLVTDELSQALQGVEVFVKGKQELNAVSNAEGVYEIEIQKGKHILIFRKEGFNETELEVETGAVFDVTLTSLEANSFDMDLETLIQMDVVTSTKTKIQLNDAPAAMTVITSSDIERHGYRNLAQALQQVPEVYAHYTGHHTTADFRGLYINFYSRRVLYLIDGHRINERFHFGDFEPDIIGDLSNIDRIEVVRGPGSPLYGNVAVLGVVNIITKDASKLKNGEFRFSSSFSMADLGENSLTQKSQFNFRHKVNDNVSMSAHLYYYNSDVMYDTKTQNTVRPWSSSYTIDGVGMANILRSPSFDTQKPNEQTWGGAPLVNGKLKLSFFDFGLNASWQSIKHTWAYPIDNQSFNASGSIRPAAMGSVYLDWLPKNSALEQFDIYLKIAANVNTAADITTHSASDYVYNTDGTIRQTMINGNLQNVSQFRQRFYENGVDGMQTTNKVIRNGNSYVDYYTQFRSTATDATAMLNGGGGTKRYSGRDFTWGFQGQVTPYKNDWINVTIGGNYEHAEYYNLHWFNWNSNKLFAYSSGIADKGWYAGVWTQAIVDIIEDKFLFIGGIRYDYQKIDEVYRHLGGVQQYRKINSALPWDATNSNNNLEEFRVSDHVSIDLSPRVALNYKYNDDGNIRLLYSKAFRAVPPQEIIRLPRDFGIAESEIMNDYELILSQNIGSKMNVTLAGFYMNTNKVYQWNAALHGFNSGEGWSNTGGSLEFKYKDKNLSAYASGTFYQLKRSTDAYPFLRDWSEVDNWLPDNKNYLYRNYKQLSLEKKPLDSPQLLIKGGASYYIDKFDAFATLDCYYNGSITMLTATNWNIGDPDPRKYIADANGAQIDNPNYDSSAPDYIEYKVPASFFANLVLQKNFKKGNMKGFSLRFKIENLFNTDVWNILVSDAQNWDSNTYYKPNQLPDFGRRYSLTLAYRL